MEKKSNEQRKRTIIIGVILSIVGAIILVMGFYNFNAIGAFIGSGLLIGGINSIRMKTNKDKTNENNADETPLSSDNYILSKNENSKIKICNSCGEINDSSNNYCSDCGIQIKKDKGSK